MTKVYGHSDDLVEIEYNRNGHEDQEIDCFDQDVKIRFADGTIIRIGYFGEWRIAIEERGNAFCSLRTVYDRKENYRESDAYSDVFLIDSPVTKVTKCRHMVGGI